MLESPAPAADRQPEVIADRGLRMAAQAGYGMAALAVFVGWLYPRHTPIVDAKNGFGYWLGISGAALKNGDQLPESPCRFRRTPPKSATGLTTTATPTNAPSRPQVMAKYSRREAGEFLFVVMDFSHS